MPDATNYKFKPKELLEMMIKAAGVHEGRWSLSADFGLGPGTFGPSPEEAAPGMAIIIQSLGIQREASDAVGLTVDAAEANPLPKHRNVKKS